MATMSSASPASAAAGGAMMMDLDTPKSATVCGAGGSGGMNWEAAAWKTEEQILDDARRARLAEDEEFRRKMRWY